MTPPPALVAAVAKLAYETVHEPMPKIGGPRDWDSAPGWTRSMYLHDAGLFLGALFSLSVVEPVYGVRDTHDDGIGRDSWWEYRALAEKMMRDHLTDPPCHGEPTLIRRLRITTPVEVVEETKEETR